MCVTDTYIIDSIRNKFTNHHKLHTVNIHNSFLIHYSTSRLDFIPLYSYSFSFFLISSHSFTSFTHFNPHYWHRHQPSYSQNTQWNSMINREEQYLIILSMYILLIVVEYITQSHFTSRYQHWNHLNQFTDENHHCESKSATTAYTHQSGLISCINIRLQHVIHQQPTQSPPNHHNGSITHHTPFHWNRANLNQLNFTKRSIWIEFIVHDTKHDQ